MSEQSNGEIHDSPRIVVVGPDGVERRAITIRNATPDWLEVTEGLEEGEEVVLHPGPPRLRGGR